MPPPDGRVKLRQAAGSAREEEAAVGPAGLSELHANRADRDPVLRRKVPEDLGRGAQACGGELVAVAGEFIDEEHEAGGLSRPQHGEDGGALLVELAGDRRALPVSLVEPAAEIRPLPHVRGADRSDDCGRGLEEDGPEWGGLAGHRQGFAPEGLDGIPGGRLREPGAGREVLGGSLPRAQAESGHLDARLCPHLELGRGEATVEAAQALVKCGFEARGEPREPRVMACRPF